MKTWMLVVGIAILILISSAFTAFADNPFIGRWSASDGENSLKVSVSRETVTVLEDTRGEIGVGSYPYTFDGQVIRVGTAAAVYNAADPGTLGLLIWLDDTPYIIVLKREASDVGGDT